MKIITFVVPCYNSSAYMEHCIESLLAGGKDIEIILVNDGSTDDTPTICDRYQEKYPDIIRVIHQENGGHGEGVNQGIRNATGLYFKVVDSDDWLDGDAMKKMLQQLRTFVKEKNKVDLLICNYVYEHAIDKTSRVMRYTNVLPQNRVFTWNDCKKFRVSQYILMHSVIYRTKLIRKCELELPKHTFYVDNLFVYKPFTFVKKIYYMDIDLYRYYIGREDQSVNEAIMVKRVMQQVAVTKLMIQAQNIGHIKGNQPKLANYMTNYLSMMMAISSILLTIDGTAEKEKIRQELWRYLRECDKTLYGKIRYQSLATFSCIRGKFGKFITVVLYRFARKIYHFN